MGSERLVVPEEDLKYVIKVIRVGIEVIDLLLVPERVLQNLGKWCDRMEEIDG